MPTYCLNCGAPSPVDGAKFCNSCGVAIISSQQGYTAPQQGYAPAAAPSIQRAESTVIQVAPDYENLKIKEMEIFGWNLQGRQEIHEEGEAYGRPTYLDSSTYVIKTKVSHYVKLHFARNLNLPNLDRIRQIETEYFNLPFPGHASLKGPGCFTAFCSVGIIGALAGMSQDAGTGFPVLLVYGVLVGLCIFWLKKRMNKSKEAEEICRQSLQRADELKSSVKALI